MEHIIIKERYGTLRALGREALRGNWKTAVLAMLLFNLVAVVPQFVLSWIFPSAPFVGGLYAVLVAGPLTLGCMIFILCLFRQQEARPSQIFHGFERFGKALGLYLLYSLIILLWSLIAIPGVVIAAIFPFFLPVAFLSLAPAIIAAYRYEMAFFLLADHPEIGITECLARSKEMMRGNKMKLFVLHLSFLGWGVLATLPIMIFSAIYLGSVVDTALVSSDAALPYDTFAYLASPGYNIGMLIAMAPMLWIMAYVYATNAGFYEQLAGNLRPGVIATTAEVITPDDSAQTTDGVEAVPMGDSAADDAKNGENGDRA